MSYELSREHEEFRRAVRDFAQAEIAPKAAQWDRDHHFPVDVVHKMGSLGLFGLTAPEEYGGAGEDGDFTSLCVAIEEIGRVDQSMGITLEAAVGLGINPILTYGTDEQKQTWLPRFADGSLRMAFAITEPDAGSNAHKLTTTARHDGDGWVLSGRKVFISGVDEAAAVMVVGRTEDAKTGRLKPALFIVPTDAPGFEYQPIEMDIISPDKQFMLFLDDVRLPADALVGSQDAALLQLFAGLNPERIMAASFAIGMGRYALGKAVEYAKTRQVWSTPIGAHQGVAHPLAEAKIELELAKVMTQKAAALYDSGDDMAAGESANMAKYAAAEASIKAVDAAVQVHGGNGMTAEYGLGALVAAARVNRIAPVSREMILNFVAQNTLGLPKSY
jgi:alkylation response protein AidB-like acyl-CoA dehydrogenase